MLKEFTITRSETHYVTYDVFYHVTAETQEEAKAEVEKYWDAESKAQMLSRLRTFDKFSDESYFAEKSPKSKNLQRRKKARCLPMNRTIYIPENDVIDFWGYANGLDIVRLLDE